MGIDILGIDIMGVDILGIDIPAPTLIDSVYNRCSNRLRIILTSSLVRLY